MMQRRSDPRLSSMHAKVVFNTRGIHFSIWVYVSMRQTFEIGMIRFGGEGIETDDGWLVGKVEADDLLLKRFSGQVIVHEFGEIDHTLWKCAMSGGGFLDAVLKTAFYLERFARDESLSDDEHARTQAAHVCASLAGGEKMSGVLRDAALLKAHSSKGLTKCTGEQGGVSASRKPVPRFRSAEPRHSDRISMLINHPRPPGVPAPRLFYCSARAKLRSKAASAPVTGEPTGQG